ncbi:IMP 5'-nucleotidase [Lachancea thermotolerans CBS 6340]|uniref:IMP-specific 5'-nucleotidase 1 n=1 Tax=Lachancea thermotolerans (strain ATCC 56472 / CBS 6340 / NRRL Y-8284) TaxID=559295 RepID=C5DLS3_LACTC|nr:KLTH0G03036p [Lachancea thermotolerans CBS 6340]CAR24734.1 KLTH0G03036p [Lachancea thermotolerans CBS 6340]
MPSRYRVEYQLKSHRKDELIEWIKGLLAVPFVLHSASHDPAARQILRQRYAEVFVAVEALIDEQVSVGKLARQSEDREFLVGRTRLAQLVPSIGPFFTRLPLRQAFLHEDHKRAISARTMVSPSFNDIRHILNSAQILQMRECHDVRLVTFDGDVTLYEDGGSLTATSKVVPFLLSLLRSGICVGIVTAAGYDEAQKYMERLFGLMTSLKDDTSISADFKRNLVVLGGESNYLFRYEPSQHELVSIENKAWIKPPMCHWSESDMTETLDLAESLLRDFRTTLNLPEESTIIRKPRAVGIVPGNRWNPETKRTIRVKMDREQLEEMVLTLQHRLEDFAPARRIQFSCFDGGSDVWCDIGGKDLGVAALQHYFDPYNPIKPCQTMHIGDQFAPMGSANDFKARLSGCTLWISSPQETVEVLRCLTAGFDHYFQT